MSKDGDDSLMPKRKGLLSRAFNAVMGKPGWRRKLNIAFLTAYLGYFGTLQYTFQQANDRDEILTELNLTEEQLEGLADSRIGISYPENDDLYYYERTTLSNELMGNNDFFREAREAGQYPLHGYALHYGGLSPGQFADTLTLVFFGHNYPGMVIIPSSEIRLTDLVEQLSGGLYNLSEDEIPGTLQDYRRIILFHELAHTGQSPFNDLAYREYDADRKALAHYLKIGGNPDVVAFYIEMRILSGLQGKVDDFNIARDGTFEADEYPYVMGPLLAKEFKTHFSQTAISSLDSTVKAYEAAVKALAHETGNNHISSNMDGLYRLSQTALHNPYNPYREEASAILRQFARTYERHKPAPYGMGILANDNHTNAPAAADHSLPATKPPETEPAAPPIPGQGPTPS